MPHRLAHLDCFAGIAGDMFLGALVHAGVPAAVLQQAAAALPLQATLEFESVDRCGISALKAHVLEHGHPAEAPAPASHSHTHNSEHSHSHEPEHKHSHEPNHNHSHEPAHPHAHGRSLTVIRDLINAAALDESVKTFALHTFDLLGAAEAKIHNVPVDKIHFHEVGAVDAIVDIVAASAGIHHLGVDAWHVSAINVGGGMVACAHGLFPVPAPAAADLLRGLPTYSAHLQKELVTPTGAALLRALNPSFGPQPPLVAASIGYGAGSRNPETLPNVLRLTLGSAAETSLPNPAFPSPAPAETSTEPIAVLETALDDASPQLLAHVAELALAAGALDVMLTPVLMKKGRPGTLLTLLCRPAEAARFQQLLLRETTTLGVRFRLDQRVLLDRAFTTVDTAFGPIRIKSGSQNGEERNAAPEYEDCRAAAALHAVPFKQVWLAALLAYRR